MTTSVDQIVADVEDQPDTRRAVARLIDHLAGALPADGGADLAIEVLDRTGDLTDAVLRIAEQPSDHERQASEGQPEAQGAGAGATGPGYAQADAALGIEPETSGSSPDPGPPEEGYGGDAPVGGGGQV